MPPRIGWRLPAPRPVYVAALACCALLLAGSALGQSSLTSLWKHGDFSAAREQWQALGDGASIEAVAEAARAAEECSDFDAAAEFYARLAQLVGEGEVDLYLEARRKQWQMQKQQSRGLLDSDWRSAAHAELQSGATLSGRAESRRLTLELAAVLEEIDSGTLQPSAELREQFPASPVTLRAAKNASDALAALKNDGDRISAAKKLLADFPGCYWQHMGYRHWLFSLARMGDREGLKATASAYLQAYPNVAVAHGSVSRYYLELGIEPDAGYSAAQRSVELYERLLGISGDASLAEVNVSSKSDDDAGHADWMPPSQRELFTEYLGSRFNLARYELARGQRKSALALAEPVVKLNPFTLDEEQSLTPFLLIAGQAHESLSNYEAAYVYYLGALVKPDAQGRYSLQAEPGLKRCSEKLNDRQLQTAQNAYMPSGVAAPSFTDITVAAGLDEFGAMRASWADVDGDSDPDLLLDGTQLLINKGRSGFKDATADWGLGALAKGHSGRFGGGLGSDESYGSSVGACFGDYDNDGDLDCYAFGHGRGGDVLWRNEGGKFVDVTPISGMTADEQATEAATWFDFDRDGLLDLYAVGFGVRSSLDNRASRTGAVDKLYRNTGRAFGVADLPDSGVWNNSASSSVVAMDFNEDGFSDLYAAGRFGAEELLRIGSSVGFRSAGRGLGVSGMGPDLELASSAGTAVFAATQFGDSWGASAGDLNGDGLLDLLVPQRPLPGNLAQSTPLQLFLTGDGRFNERRASAGIKADSHIASTILADLNNDGRLDIYLCASGEGQRSALYVNSGQGRFHDVTYFSGARAFNLFGGASADIDGDGDSDLLLCSRRGIKLLRNDSTLRGAITVTCRGSGPAAAGVEPGSNRAGIGTRITLILGALNCVRTVQASNGLGCGDDLVQSFAFNATAGTAELTVRFPSGKVLTESIELGPDVELIADEAQGIMAVGKLPADNPAKPVRDKQDEVERPARPIFRQRPGGGR